ncbi:MAG: hypothetical protein KIT73_00635 [Burkholderiales bacterium]|nr:hypothetical protein [Burkholderiales bacterium]
MFDPIAAVPTDRPAESTGAAATLDLLSPWMLAPHVPLSDAHRPAVHGALRMLLTALDLSSDTALTQLDQALAALPVIDAQPLQPSMTATHLTPDEVHDYDRYFGLRHVQTAAPAVNLTRGLLTMTRSFVLLCERVAVLDPAQVELQKEGLRVYAHLLARTFDLEVLGR